MGEHEAEGDPGSHCWDCRGGRHHRHGCYVELRSGQFRTAGQFRAARQFPLKQERKRVWIALFQKVAQEITELVRLLIASFRTCRIFPIFKSHRCVFGDLMVPMDTCCSLCFHFYITGLCANIWRVNLIKWVWEEVVDKHTELKVKNFQQLFCRNCRCWYNNATLQTEEWRPWRPLNCAEYGLLFVFD